MENQNKLILRKLHRSDAWTFLANVLIGSEFVRINDPVFGDVYKLVNDKTFEKAKKEYQETYDDELANFFLFLQKGGFPKFESK